MSANSRRARALVLLAAALWSSVLLAPSALAAIAPEHSVKAVYIYRFLDFVTWPSDRFRSPDDAILIGVTQVDEVAEELALIARERTSQGRPLRIVTVREARDLPVHVLYLPNVDSGRARALLEHAREQPTLIVANAPRGLEAGAVINLVRTGDRVQFEIALDAAARAGLAISSRLLSVALRVRKSRSGTFVLASGLPEPSEAGRCANVRRSVG
jgi:hypothetical protein